jgi:hypothetical protein
VLNLLPTAFLKPLPANGCLVVEQGLIKTYLAVNLRIRQIKNPSNTNKSFTSSKTDEDPEK